jgi:hypothetical protein
LWPKINEMKLRELAITAGTWKKCGNLQKMQLFDDEMGNLCGESAAY